MFDLSKVKVVITDFDLTLYSYGNWDNSDEYYFKYLKENNLVPKTMKSMKEIRVMYPNMHAMKSTFCYLKDNGIDNAGLFKYLTENIYDIITDKTQPIDTEILQRLTEKYPTYLITDSVEKYIDHYLEVFKMQKSWFKKCVSNDYKVKPYSKARFMKKIMIEEGVEPYEVLMVGDSLECDIKPAKRLGFQTFHVQNVEDTEKLFLELAKQKMCNINNLF